MGEAGPVGGLSDAAGRPAVDRLAARSALIRFWSRFRNDQRGATAVEVGVIVALITVVLMGALGLVGESMKASFTKVNTTIQAAIAAG
jgi:pilus assembly protein Flp/PilA